MYLDLNNAWTRKLPNGNTEYYSKIYYNADFTRRKETLEEKFLTKCEKILERQEERDRQKLLFKVNTILI